METLKHAFNGRSVFAQIGRCVIALAAVLILSASEIGSLTSVVPCCGPGGISVSGPHREVHVQFIAASMEKPFQGESVVRENKVKAVFIYNFTQFVEWPVQPGKEDDSPFVIGILGKDTFSEYLTEIIEGEEVDGRPIVIKKFGTVVPEVEQCQILFIEKSFPFVEETIAVTQSKPVLTVSDHENFMREKGILRLFLESDKVRFEVNRDAALTAGLEISPKLLKLATIYKNRK